jgi:hypothetical protein
MVKLIDITGQRFGRLVVVQRANSTPRGKARWLCQCDCGKAHVTTSENLRCGDTRSCGCRGRKYRHGLVKHPLYETWHSIQGRCNTLTHSNYRNYGGRGIRVCARWRNVATFINDILTSIGERPPNQTLDRIDNYGNYEPGNVRWATPLEQAYNSRRSERARQRRAVQLKTQHTQP